METNRKEFLKLSGMAGLGLAGAGILPESFINKGSVGNLGDDPFNKENISNENSSIIGIYGKWANSLVEKNPPEFSLRTKDWSSLKEWRESARKRLMERMAIPDIGMNGVPEVSVNKQYSYDGLHIEELSWQLPYGRTTKGLLLKPLNIKEPLPGILAFYDHGFQKYFGIEKITRTSDDRNPILVEHQQKFYEGHAWANEIAKRGYVVLVPDVFPFGSRRVMPQNVPQDIRQIWPGLDFSNPGSKSYIKNYNEWAAQHEHIMAKSLFSAGTTWPGVFFGEDRKSLDVLCSRDDVDTNSIGCGGLSGGGIRTNFMGGLDPRIKCAVTVGFQTTWKDLILNKSYAHTWMAFVPLLANELAYPEIFGLRAPLPTLVLNNHDDPLFTLTEQKRANGILQQVFEKANAEEHYKCSFHPGPHKFDAKMQAEAFRWFDQWLK